MKPVMKVFVTRASSQFEGHVQMPNLSLAKLRKENGCTLYATVSHLRQAASAAAKKYNSTLQFVESVAAKKTSR